MSGRRLLSVWFSIVVVLSGAWALDAQAQTADCPVDQPDGCCDPRQSVDEDQEEGLAADCPSTDVNDAGGRAHRRADDGSADTVVEENDTGSSGGNFGSGSRRGSSKTGDEGVSPDGAGGPGEPGGAPTGQGGGPSGPPTGAGTPGGGTPATPPGAVSSPGVRPPAAAAPSAAGSGSGAGAPRAGAGAPTSGSAASGGAIARTGPDVGLPVGLAMTLLVAGTSLRRAARPRRERVARRRPTARRGRRARPPAPAPTNWSYVDHSASARAIEKF